MTSTCWLQIQRAYSQCRDGHQGISQTGLKRNLKKIIQSFVQGSPGGGGRAAAGPEACGRGGWGIYSPALRSHSPRAGPAPRTQSPPRLALQILKYIEYNVCCDLNIPITRWQSQPSINMPMSPQMKSKVVEIFCGCVHGFGKRFDAVQSQASSKTSAEQSKYLYN